jgi:hypothetical protein
VTSRHSLLGVGLFRVGFVLHCVCVVPFKVVFVHILCVVPFKVMFIPHFVCVCVCVCMYVCGEPFKVVVVPHFVCGTV